MSEKRRSLPAGRPPWDTLNGIRVGGFAGAMLGGLLTALIGVSMAWLIVVGAALGAVLGYWTELRQRNQGRLRQD